MFQCITYLGTAQTRLDLTLLNLIVFERRVMHSYLPIYYNTQRTVIPTKTNERGWRRSSDFGFFFFTIFKILY